MSRERRATIRFTNDIFESSLAHVSNSALLSIDENRVEYLSFEDALKKLYKRDERNQAAVDEAKEDVEKIMKLCNDKLKVIKPLKWAKNLTDDQIMALISYTIGSKASNEPKTPPYLTVNKVLGTRNTNGLYGCREYILHILSAMRAFGQYHTNKKLYRAIAVDKFDLETYKVNTERSWPGFTSTTEESDVIEDFFVDGKTNVVFKITGDYVGYQMKGFSVYGEEEEVILEPETVFKIKKVKIVEEVVKDGKKFVKKAIIKVVVEKDKSSLLIEGAVNKFTALGRGGGGGGGIQQPTPPKMQQPFQYNHPSPPPPQQQQPPLPEGWTEEFHPCTGQPYYHNKKTGEIQFKRPEMPVMPPPRTELPLCSYPFTCHRINDATHRRIYRHACRYDRSDCPHINNPQHNEEFFHLIKDTCSNQSCPLLKDPQHRITHYHKGMPAFMTMCRERALCNCMDANKEAHLIEEFHTDTNFEFPSKFSYN